MLQPYLFLYAGRPDKTQYYVREMLNRYFFDTRDGLPGNDDSGTLSSWYLWGAMGFYPVTGQDLYLIGSPLFKKTTIRLENGNEVVINAPKASKENIYILSVKLNNKEYNRPYFTHEDIKNGAKFYFEMGNKPSKWGRKYSPPSISD